MKYSLGVGGGILFGTELAGILHAQGKREPEKGEKIQKLLLTNTNRADHVELGRIIINSFKEIGVEVETEILELAAFVSKAYGRHETELANFNWSGGMERIDPSFYLTEFYHSKYAAKGGRNFEHYRNPEYDKVCDAANMEMDRNKRIALVKRCQEILARDCPIWLIGFPDILNAYNSQDWEGPVGMLGCGIGSDYIPWTWLLIKPKSDRKKIVTANVEELLSFSLGASSGNARSFLRMIYDTFLKVDPKMNVVPWAASSWKIVSPKIVDITLRDGMKFHDGKPVTMEDVRFTFDYLREKKPPRYNEINIHVLKTEVLNNRQFRFHLAEPYGPFLENILSYAHILPKHIWERIQEPDTYPNEKPIGSGPFKFGYWKQGEELYLEANKEHFAPPKIDGFYRKVISSLEGVLAALENKEIDIHHDRLDSEMAKRLEKFPHLTVVSTPNNGVYEMRGNLDKKPFSDLQFRKAINHIIPKRQAMAQIFGKAGRAAGNTIIHPDLKPWYNEKVGFDEYSPQRAKEILRAAGYWWDKDGFLHYPK